jgi:hypothetical protein
MVRLRLFTLSCVLALLVSSASAQIATTTSLVGTITDASGKSVPGTVVTAVETQTHDTHSTVTNDQGYYSIEFIRVGVYDVTAQAPGFEKVTKAGVHVEINQVLRTDITIVIGTVTPSVTVAAQAMAIKTDDATVSEVLGTRNVADLPLNGRDAMMLPQNA